jgi:lipopolysaccharide export LptBFGC system permease protein LptF
LLTTLDRYVIRHFAVNYLIAIASMIGLYIVLDLLFNLDEFVEGDRGVLRVIGNILSFYGYNVFLYFAQISGVITLFAAACTLARMQKNNELVGIMAVGTSLHRVAVPVVLAGLAANLLWIVDQEVIIPAIAPKLAREHEDVEGTRARDLYFIDDHDKALLSALDFQPRLNQMRQLTVIRRDSSGSFTECITADRATWDEQAKAWRLERGVRHKRAAADADFGSADQAERTPIDLYQSDLTPEELVLRQAATWLDLLSLRQLSKLAEGNFVDPQRVTQIKHGRFALPFMNLLLLLLGVPFFLTREPSGVLVQAAKCLLNCGLCFTVTFLSHNVIHSESFPALTAWFPIMVFGPLAVLYLDGLKT